MNCITPTSASDFNQAAYYNIITEIEISGELTIPKGSVLDFCGGSFCGSGTINLNGAKVVAVPYCIFCKDVSVSGFAQSEVLAEWFNDKRFFPSTSSGTETNTVGEEVFINKAIQCARGCPVVTNARQYKIKGPITFIPGTTPQTLICPGELFIDSLDGTKIAILLEDVSNVTLRVNKLKGNSTKNADNSYTFRGTGICFRGNVQMADIDVFMATGFTTGLDLSPKVTANGAYIQDCKFKFQLIHATTCIKIDLFAHNTVSDYPNCWITSNQFHGGRLSGENGIVFGTPDNDFFDGGTMTRPAAHVNSLVFDCLGIEKLTKSPIYLAYVTQSKFLDLRMMEALPGISTIEGAYNSPWISLYNVSDIEIGVKGAVRTSHLSIVKQFQQFTPPVLAPDPYFPNVVNNVIIKGDVVDSGYTQAHYDTVVFRSTPNSTNSDPEPQMFVTSSVQPYNMAKVVTRKDFGPHININTDSVTPQITSNLEVLLTKLLPTLNVTSSVSNGYNNPLLTADSNAINVIPDTVFIDLTNKDIPAHNKEWKILLDGIWRLPKIIPSFYINLPADNKVTFVKSSDKTIKLLKDFGETMCSSISFTRGGLFRLEWAKQVVIGGTTEPVLRIIRVAE